MITERFAKTLPMLLLGSAVVALLVPLRGQVAAPLPPVPAKEEKKEEKKANAMEAMTFPADRDAKNKLQAVKDYLAEFKDNAAKAPWGQICEAAQFVLEAKSDSFFESPSVGGGAPVRISAKVEANRLIGEFPKAGRDAYENSFGGEARRLLLAAETAGDPLLLAEISQRFFHTIAGAEATLQLADAHLERGNYSEAAFSYERLLQRPESEQYWTALAAFKALAALKRSGATPNNPSLKPLLEILEKKFPRDGLELGKRNYSLDDLKAELNLPAEQFVSRIAADFHAMRYGDITHTARWEGGKPFLDPLWSHSLAFQNSPLERVSQGNEWVEQELNALMKYSNNASLPLAMPGFYPVSAKNLLLIRNYEGVSAVVTKDGYNLRGKPGNAGDKAWSSPLYGSAATLFSDSVYATRGYNRNDINSFWQSFREKYNGVYRSILFENPLNGSLAHDGRLVYAIDEAALPPPPPDQNNEFAMVGINPNGAPTLGKIGFQGHNELVAIDLETGLVQWRLGEPLLEKPLTEEEENNPKNPLALNPLYVMQNCFFLGPPLPVNGKIYVIYERNGTMMVACLDPHLMQSTKIKKLVPETYFEEGREAKRDVEKLVPRSHPTLLWTQKLGEPSHRLPQDTARRFQCSYLAYANGVLICPTNSGAVVAIDAMNRNFLWAKSYRLLKPVGGAGGAKPFNNPNGMNLGQSPLNPNRWRAPAPIVSQGRVVFAAYDSDDLLCLDLRTGDLIWKEPRRQNDLYVAGLIGENILIIGKDNVRAVKLFGEARDKPLADGRETVSYAWTKLDEPEKMGLPSGHGVASRDGLYYLPLSSSALKQRSQVWAINAANGKVEARPEFHRRTSPPMKADPARKEPFDPNAKPVLGNLIFHEGQLYSQTARELDAFPLLDIKEREMTRKLAANPKDPGGLLDRGEIALYKGNLPEAIEDFRASSAGKPDGKLRERLEDKLFDAYTRLLLRDFSTGERYLADYKALCGTVAKSDDPNDKLRNREDFDRRQRLYLELLAKGRESQGRLIEAFDAYREFANFGGSRELVALSDEPNGRTRPDVWARGRIDKMINAAKDGAARKSLQDLVDREWAGVKDGKDLAKLRDFVGIFGQYFPQGREAELLLGTRLADAKSVDDQREAQAVLARLAATAEEPALAARALELLAVMATRKGQADAAISLYMTLGDRYANVVVRDGLTGADLLNNLLTDKRLLPYLEPVRTPTPEKVKAVRENGNTGYQQSFILEPDGATNEPFHRRHRLTLSNESGNGWTLRVLDRGSGEEKWKVPGLQMYNPTGNVNYRIAQARGNLLLLHMGVFVYCFDLAEKRRCWEYPIFGDGLRLDMNNSRYNAGGDDELVIENFTTDGIKFTVGRASILESHYAALITREGLVALDPATGNKLWTRTNLSPSSVIFGDGKHIFAVETVNGKSTHKVFRAVDGTPVEGVEDFSALATGPGRIRILGRFLLLTEGGNLKDLVVRLYDPLSGKDVWRKEYKPQPEPPDFKNTGLEFKGNALLVKTYTPETVGVFERNGNFELLDTLTGKTVFQSAIDPKFVEKHAPAAALPVLLADHERYYLVLNRNNEANNRTNMLYAQIRFLPTSGPMYCFEKATGKRAWMLDKVLENQCLFIERFAEVPALVMANNASEWMSEGGEVLGRGGRGGSVYRAVVVDKVNGKVRFRGDFSQNNGNFYMLTTDPRQSTARFIRGDLALVISPDDGSPPSAAANGKKGDVVSPPVMEEVVPQLIPPRP